MPVLLLGAVAFEWNGIPGQDRDTRAYYDAAVAARTGAPLYDPMPPGPHEFVGHWPYLYAPPLAALLSPLPEMSYRTFDRAWLMLNLLAFWTLAASLARVATGRWSTRGALSWGAVLFFWPGALAAFHFGNIELVVLALAGLALAVPLTSGVALGFAAAFKVAPGWGLLPFLWRRPGRTLTGILGAVVVCIGASLMVFGWPHLWGLLEQWVRVVLPSTAQGQFWGESLAGLRDGVRPMEVLRNLSISFLPVQLAVVAGWDYAGGPLPPSLRIYLTVFAIGAPTLTAWLMRGHSLRLQAATVFAAAVLAPPIVRLYALPSLLLVLAAWRAERLGLPE